MENIISTQRIQQIQHNHQPQQPTEQERLIPPKDLAEINALKKIKIIEKLDRIDETRRSLSYCDLENIVVEYMIDLSPYRDYRNLSKLSHLDYDDFIEEMKEEPDNELLESWIHNSIENVEMYQDLANIIQRMLFYAGSDNAEKLLSDNLICTIKCMKDEEHRTEELRDILWKKI